MTLTRKQTALILFLAALAFGFTLFQASWLAEEPTGKPKLIADRAADPVRDSQGCVASANSGYGGVMVSPDIAALQAAAGSGANAILIRTAVADGALKVAPQFVSTCAADNMRAHATLADAAAGMTRPELFWQITGADQAAMFMDAAPALDRSFVIGDDAAVAALRKTQPTLKVFSVNGAQKCASDYRLSGLWGNVPASCKNGIMLLTLDDVGYTLWGWPNRFLARMKDAGVHVIIAQDVADGQIKGLTDVNQYGDIARTFNGYIWVDNIEELGPALRR